MDRRTMVTMILRDISKAFDKVWHDGLRYKMMGSGLEGPLLRSLSDFLRDRMAYIRIRDEKGERYGLSAGVPQGDVLSPTLYIIMCNDYPDPENNGT